ncbi:MAG: DNA primase [Polyangiaceae bacterium]
MIAPETIALVKERTDIVALVGESVRLSRSGRSWKGLCPFHKEKSGSFYVHPERGFYHCFGCGESGSAIDFVMKQNGLDFVEAVKFLGERAGIPIEETRDRKPQQKNTLERDDVFAVNALAAGFFEKQLALGQRGQGHACAKYAIAEIEKRGMPRPGAAPEEERAWSETLVAFRVGYAPPEWDGLASYLRAQGVAPLLGERAGLLVPRSTGSGHYDRFRHRLMFSVMDALGRIVAFSGRALEAPDPSLLPPGAPAYGGAEPPAKYINSPESPVYTKGQHVFGLFQAKRTMRERSSAILVEGNFDVVTLHARGIGEAVAPLGTAFTAEQAKLLKRFAPLVTLAFDGDAAGAKATRAARVPCREGGLDAKVARLPKGLDPDAFVRERGPAAFRTVIQEASGLLEHLVADALDDERFTGATLEERVARVKAVARLLSEENDENVRHMAKTYADRLSRRLVMNNESPADLTRLERLLAVELAGGDRGPQRPAPAPQANKIVLDAVGALFDAPELLDDPDVVSRLGDLSGDAALAIVALRRARRPLRGVAHEQDPRQDAAAHTEVDPEVLLASLPRSIQVFAAQRLASPLLEAREAKGILLENIELLRNESGRHEKAGVVKQLSQASSLTREAEDDLLLQAQLHARKKLGLD